MITTCQQCGGLRADHLESFAGTPCRCHSFPAPGSVNDTPETDALRQKLWGEEWSVSYLTMMSHARKLERERDAIAAALQETLALLNHSDTSYPSQEGWWSYERARELEALIPQNGQSAGTAN